MTTLSVAPFVAVGAIIVVLIALAAVVMPTKRRRRIPKEESQDTWRCQCVLAGM